MELCDLMRMLSLEDTSLPGLPLPATTRRTLFLDLDETLILAHICLRDKQPPDHYDFTPDNKAYIITRPGVDWLLQAAVDCAYEIVIFTAGTRLYASKIINRIDPTGLITHRLYRESCKQINWRSVRKDLASTGRRLSTCVIFEDKPHRVLQRDNVVRVKPFIGDKQDSEIESRYEDLRDAAARMNESFVSD